MEKKEKDRKKTEKNAKYLRTIYNDLHRLNHLIDNTEYSRSDRARCRYCRKLIGKGTIRGNKYHKPSGYPYHMKMIFCTDCTIELLKEEQKEISRMLKKIRGIKRRRKAYEEEKLLREKDSIVQNFLNE